MKKIIVCMMLAVVMGIIGCMRFAPAALDENRPQDGIRDPYYHLGGHN